MLHTKQHALAKTWVVFAALVFVSALVAAQFAWGDEAEDLDAALADMTLPEETSEELASLQAQIESTAADYDEAVARIEELQGKIDENQTRIDEIIAALPGQQASAASALKSLYVLQSEGFDIISLALESNDLNDFLQQVEYIERIHQHSAIEISKLDSMKTELEETQDQLSKDKEEADTAADRAERAMEQAKNARKEAQEHALAEAQAEMEANEAANQAAMAAAAEAAAAAQAQGADSEAVAAAAQQAFTSAGGSTSAAASLSAINWDMSKEDFVSEWTSRINEYLDGTAMAGQGENYAEAAWKYGVDPRISPAISTVESATGSVCFRDYNAWGWGNSSWSSWDEAIDAHVSGYAKGYSNNVTAEDASKYCPPNATEWQNQVINNMESM